MEGWHMAECPVCQWQLPTEIENGSFGFNVKCQRCGDFTISGTAQPLAKRRLNGNRMLRAVLSHSIRRMQRADGPRLLIDPELLKQILKEEKLPAPSAQADNLVRLIGERQPFVDEYAMLDPAEASAVMGTSDVGVTSPTSGFSYIADE